jgi:hypothetical protein
MSIAPFEEDMPIENTRSHSNEDILFVSQAMNESPISLLHKALLTLHLYDWMEAFLNSPLV